MIIERLAWAGLMLIVVIVGFGSIVKRDKR